MKLLYNKYLTSVAICFLLMGCQSKSELIINNNSNNPINVFYCVIETIDSSYYNQLKHFTNGQIYLRERISAVRDPEMEDLYEATFDNIDGCANVTILPHKKARIVYSLGGEVFEPDDSICKSVGKIIITQNHKILYEAEKKYVRRLFHVNNSFGLTSYQLDILKEK